MSQALPSLGASSPQSAAAYSLDQDLVLKCQAKDRAAFEQLVRRYQNKVFTYVSRMTHDPDDAEDLAQETFIKAFLSITSFRGESSVQTWLYRIATNLCIDRSRRKRRQVPTAFSLDEPVEDEDDDLAREIPDHSYDPSRLLERKELRSRVRACLQALSPKLRAVIVMFDLQGLSYDEIAEVLGCPLGTVKSRLFHARMELGRKLQSYVLD